MVASEKSTPHEGRLLHGHDTGFGGRGQEFAGIRAELEGLDTRVALIQALIPLALAAVEEILH